jgi:DNA-binding SARP family transcriptional activator
VGPVLELGLLGPFEARIDGGLPVGLGGTRQKALLAVLGLRANEVVSTDGLIDQLWGEHPPARAVHTVQVFVSRLRGALGAAGERLLTRPPGYVLELGPDEVDANRCERLYDGGRSALHAGNPAGADELLQAALDLWRGAPLADFTYEPFAQATIARLQELKLSCREEVIEAGLELGRHAEVVSALEGLVREEPLRERPRGQLMLALYRCGRQAEALEAFQRARRMLVEELALDPSRALQELEQRILRQDPSLEVLSPAPIATRGSNIELRVKDDASLEPPDKLAEPVAGRQPSEFVRKTVTVLVVRLELSVRADPEVTRARIAVGRSEAERIVRNLGGSVISRLGGEVLAVFGVPLTMEDDALRALRALEELRRRLSELGSGESGELVLRAFVDTGEVVADGAGDLSGEPVSHAIELVHAAQPSEVLFSHATRRLAGESIQTEPALDGAAWRLMGVAASESGLRRPERPMVGRDPELAAARSMFERAVLTHNSHLLTVVGDAGIGKSRLAQELVDELGDEATVLMGRCLSYGEGIALWPLREAITHAAGGESRDAIRGLLDRTDDADVVADIVAGALGLAPAEGIGEQAPWGFRRLLEMMSSDGPVVLVLEDVHWGDDALLDLVDYLIDWLTVPALLLCLSRPELLDARPSWGGGHARISSIVLGPLGEPDAQEMLDQHLGHRKLSPSERAQILAAAEGNPLYVEQLLHASAEDPGWAREPHAPATIQSLLASRLDRLGPGERAFIERAAVIGREFWPAAVIDLLPAEARASAPQHLRALVHRGLIHPDRSTLAGEEQLRFHHILICDVAYRSTPKALRGELHEHFADWLARRSEQYDEFVGYHFEQAFRLLREIGRADAPVIALAERAGNHLTTAGRRAAVRGDAESAVRLLRRSADLFHASDLRRPDVLLDLGTALRDACQFQEAERVLNATLEQAGTAHAEALGARALIELASLRALVDSSVRVEEVLTVAHEAMVVFERLRDDAGLSRALLEVADVHWTRCCIADMEGALERALTHAERAASTERAWILRSLAQAAVMGPRRVDDAMQRCNAIFERVADDALSAGFTQTMLAVLEAMDGRFDQARTLWRESQERLRGVGRSVSASALETYHAFFELMSETPMDVGPELAEACALLQRIGERSRLSTVAAFYARLLYVQGRYDQSEHYAALSADAAADDDVASQLVMRGTRAKLMARHGEAQRAKELMTGVMTLVAETDFLILHGDALRDRAEVLTILGRPGEAAEDLKRALDLYERKGVRVAATGTRGLQRSLVKDLTTSAPG